MPHKQFHIVEKIKFLVSSSLRSKRQIVNEVEDSAQNHLINNQRQEREDNARVDHARKELKEENRVTNNDHLRLSQNLGVSIFINFIFLVIFVLICYFLFYR